MEQQEKQFDAVLKKSVAMYSMLTGKPMTEREGRAFIEIFDMTEAYLTNGTQAGAASEAFNIISSVDIPQFVGRAVDDDITPTPRKEIFIDPASPDGDRSVTAFVDTGEDGKKTITVAEPLDICGCRVGECTCQRSEKVAKQLGVNPLLMKQVADFESAGAKKRYTPPPITSNQRDHIQGYDWQICVLSREKERDDSYVVHFAEMPTQAQLNEHFIKFHDRTHYVHVNEFVNWCWEGITDRYDRSAPTVNLTTKDEVVRTAPAPELRDRDVSMPHVTADWEQDDKPFRIRYYSDEATRVIFHYCDKRPTGAEMAHFHHAKCMAVSQAKPKPGIAA